MFNPNLDKLKSCIVWVLAQRWYSPQEVTNIIFQAEIDHLNLYARPITGVLYHKDNLIHCLALEKIYNELSPLNKPLPPVSTDYLSISDLECLKLNLDKKLILPLNLTNLAQGAVINYQSLVFNPEVLAYLTAHEGFDIVI
jgi:hypothetical protein